VGQISWEIGKGSQPFPPDVMTSGADIVDECSAGMNTQLIRVKNTLQVARISEVKSGKQF
jgi:hypothetical protein